MTAAAGSGRFACALALLASCRAVPEGYTLDDRTDDAFEAADVRAMVEQGMTQVEAFFGAPFPRAFEVVLVPDRAAFSAALPAEWGLGETQCWMVASGVSDRLYLLAPSSWSREACEHDPHDRAHVRGIVVHELVHVYHGQHNPTGDFTGCDAIGWFVEGLATYASGQLEREHAGRARAAIEAGTAPRTLEDAWSGKYRYGIAGSLAGLVDRAYGRAAIVELLSATSEEEILASLELGEDELLELWRGWVGEPE